MRLIDRIVPIGERKDGYLLDRQGNIHRINIFTELKTDKMPYTPDNYLEERISDELLKLNLNGKTPQLMGYERFPGNNGQEKIILYNISKPHLIELYHDCANFGFLDKYGNKKKTGSLRTLPMLNRPHDIELVYTFVKNDLEQDKSYGFVPGGENKSLKFMAIYEIKD